MRSAFAPGPSRHFSARSRTWTRSSRRPRESWRRASTPPRNRMASRISRPPPRSCGSPFRRTSPDIRQSASLPATTRADSPSDCRRSAGRGVSACCFASRPPPNSSSNGRRRADAIPCWTSDMVMVGLALALVIGLTLGMLGGGGSILTVPVFVYVLGYDPKLAIAMSLPVVGATSLVGAIGHWRAGNVRVPVTLVFGGVAMAAAFITARLSVYLSGRIQLFIFGIMMLTAAMLMLRDSPKPSAPAIPAEGRNSMPVALPLAGLAVGALTGIVGIGGGFLIVPALLVLPR